MIEEIILDLEYFVSFIGYPRSGHTLVAAIINANPDAICWNQLNVFNKDDFSFSECLTDPAGQTWKDSTLIQHVPKNTIKVLGDKTGHRTTLLLQKNPQKLGEIKSKLQIPIKFLHVVRNPFDNIATWAIIANENKKTSINHELNKVIDEYVLLNETIARLKRSEDVLTVKHEYVITRMHNTLEEIANFLELSFDPIWRDNVRNAVWKKPRITRRQVPWTQKQKGTVHDIIAQYDWLKGYDFGGCGRC